MKPVACNLALTLLSANAVCPACGWPANDHATYPHRKPPPFGALEGDEPVEFAFVPPTAPEFVEIDARTLAMINEPDFVPDGFDARTSKEREPGFGGPECFGGSDEPVDERERAIAERAWNEGADAMEAAALEAVGPERPSEPGHAGASRPPSPAPVPAPVFERKPVAGRVGAAASHGVKSAEDSRQGARRALRALARFALALARALDE